MTEVAESVHAAVANIVGKGENAETDIVAVFVKG